ncbi:hypothetical protein Dda_2485 [Drechslerella dactyloides]|uniref:Uncharacterized protein n=1 Tax=Drechslerella dactyloides TaxID=74499 RepID=A0AAD6J416_DREDA|nr:hypothetical protein Dda_2485 [Drechslerella dactyloides]
MQRLTHSSVILLLSLSLTGVLARPYPQGGSQDGTSNTGGTNGNTGGGMAIENEDGNANLNQAGTNSPSVDGGYYYDNNGNLIIDNASQAGQTNIEEENDYLTQTEYLASPNPNGGGDMMEEEVPQGGGGGGNAYDLTPPSSFTFDDSPGRTTANGSPSSFYEEVTDNEYDPNSPAYQRELDNTIPSPDRQGNTGGTMEEILLNFNPTGNDLQTTEILPSTQFESSNNIVIDQGQDQQQDQSSDEELGPVPQDGGVYEVVTIENEGEGENMRILTVKPDLDAIDEKRRADRLAEENARAWANSHPRDRQAPRYGVQQTTGSPNRRPKVLPDYLFEPEALPQQQPNTQSTTRIIPDPGTGNTGTGSYRKRPTKNQFSQHPFAQSFRNMLLGQGGLNAGGINQGMNQGMNQGSRENPINLDSPNPNAPSFRTAQNIFQSFGQGMNNDNTPTMMPGLRRTQGTIPNTNTNTNRNTAPLAMTGLGIRRNEASPFNLNMANAQRGTYQSNPNQANTYQSILDRISTNPSNNRFVNQPRIQPLPGQGRQRTTGGQSGRSGYIDYSRVNTNNLTPEQISELFQRMEEQQARMESMGVQQPQTRTQPQTQQQSQPNFLSSSFLGGGSGMMGSLADEGINQNYGSNLVPSGTGIIDLLEENSSQIPTTSQNNANNLNVSSDEADPGSAEDRQLPETE